MIRPVVARLFPAFSIFPHLIIVLTIAVPTPAQQAPVALETNPGRFFTVVEPITHEGLTQLAASTKQLVDQATAQKEGNRPVLIFEFRPGEASPGGSPFGASYDLAEFLSTKLEGAKLTVAYVTEPLKGYAVLPVLACDEIVMGPEASLGPIAPEGTAVNSGIRELVKNLAIRKGRDPELLLGMLDRDADLRAVRTADKQIHYLLPQRLPEFQKTHQIIQDQPAWEGGRRAVLTAKRARDEGFSKLTADKPAEVARAYHLAGQASSNDPTLGQIIKPIWIKIDGPIDTVKKSYLTRRIEQARQDHVNLIFFEINSKGGIDHAADGIADLLVGTKDMKTVAYIDDRATGVTTLIPLACHDVVFKKTAQMGDVSQLITGRDQFQTLSPGQVEVLADRAAYLAEKKGHPIAVARAMVDPKTQILQATDSKTGAVCFLLPSQIDAEPGRYLNPVTRKEPGEVLTLTAEDALAYGLGAVVNDAEELKGLYGLRGKSISVDKPGWVDSLVTILTDPFVSWLLLFVGLFMLVVELKLPGIGLPAITSALAFLLFFWSHYLSGTADQLEIILFLVGLICLALELFVFPGVGVFGMSGVLLVLTSIVMASHTFVWPTQEYEYRELGFTLLQVIGAMAAVGGGAVVLARYFGSIPLLNRLVLKPEPWTTAGLDDLEVKPQVEGYDSLTYLIGETGRTTTVLRPSGKARFGEMLIDVTADGFYIEPNSLIEVVDVQGQRVIVRQVGS